MKKILLDTSFVVKCAEYHIDLFSELERVCLFPYELCYFNKTLDELDAVARQGGKERAFAKLARKFLERATVIPGSKCSIVDELILDYLQKNKECVVATHDSALKKMVLGQKIPVVIIRQQKYLVFQG